MRNWRQKRTAAYQLIINPNTSCSLILSLSIAHQMAAARCCAPSLDVTQLCVSSTCTQKQPHTAVGLLLSVLHQAVAANGPSNRQQRAHQHVLHSSLLSHTPQHHGGATVGATVGACNKQLFGCQAQPAMHVTSLYVLCQHTHPEPRYLCTGCCSKTLGRH